MSHFRIESAQVIPLAAYSNPSDVTEEFLEQVSWEIENICDSPDDKVAHAEGGAGGGGAAGAGHSGGGGAAGAGGPGTGESP